MSDTPSPSTECSKLSETPSPGTECSDGDAKYVCSVCGDAATGYRFYGAASICYSCRIFFRRVVTAKQEFTCTGSGYCLIDKLSRNHCKKCRYEKCLSVGLLPYLVNTSSRKSKMVKQESAKKVLPKLPENSVIRLTQDIRPSTVPNDPSIDNILVKNNAVNVINAAFEEVFFDEINDGKFGNMILEMDGRCIKQIRENKPLIVTPPEMMSVSKQMLDAGINLIIKTFLPLASQDQLEKISKNVACNIAGLAMCVLDYFESENLLMQWKHCTIIYSERIMDAYKKAFPDIETLDPVPSNKYDMCVSPYAKHFEDEEFIERTALTAQKLFNKDFQLCRLVFLLALFSPVDADIAEEEKRLLKYFQQKVSMLIYAHLMSFPESDNFQALDTMTKIVALINDLNKIGKIYLYGLLQTPEEFCGNIENLSDDIVLNDYDMAALMDPQEIVTFDQF